MRETLAGVPEGLAPLVLARLTEDERTATPPLLLHVARDDRRLESLTEVLRFFAPKVRVLQLPAWDTVPYDRIGPNAEIVATRVATLARLTAAARKGRPSATTVNAILQRLLARFHPPLAEKHRRPAPT
jgi:transcription-repair coupling factor (superfamily II helicase)